MIARVKEIHIMHADLPLRIRFKHAITSRTRSGSVFVKAVLDDGSLGYGESLPREYVTGETAPGVIDTLKGVAQNRVLGFAPRAYADLPYFMDGLKIGGAAKCALELALVDAYGKHFYSPVSSIIGEPQSGNVVYSGVIQASSVASTIGIGLAFRMWGLSFIKVKVGTGDDIKRLKAVRRMFGPRADIRVDANCAWTPDEAIENIKRMRPYRISAVEQPVAAGDHRGLRRVTDSVYEAVVADESLCTISDAEKLVSSGACNIFNIRLSKCGGIFDSLKIARIAMKHGIGVQLGCQVGESSLLSAAGRYFAGLFKEMAFCEGSYGRFLLKEDIADKAITIRRGGSVDVPKGPGLGVSVVDKVLDKYVVSKTIVMPA